MIKLWGWGEGPQAYVGHLTTQNNFWSKSPLLGPEKNISSNIPTFALPCSVLPVRHLFISREAVSQCQWTSTCDNVIWFHSFLQKKKQSNFPTLGSRLLSQILISPAKVTILLLFFFFTVGIQASGISVPLSLLMLLGQSLNWIASQTLK